MERGGGLVATLTDSSIVKRDEKLLDSKDPVIPYGAGAQTSFKDQLKGLDGLGLRLLLYENLSEPKPKVLLRHGGTMSTGSGSNIVKRVEKHPESRLAILPFGRTGQTSCRNQLPSMDGLGLCLPLHETRLEPKHKIFLSHSGAQKSFVKQLCKDIERYDRYPFFDVLRTSLSIGCDFPKAIFEAIEQCQVAVVVLSEDFFSRTKWPMLELSALVKRKGHDQGLIIMPVFLGLTREQCRSRANHDRWLSLWQRWAKEDKRIIIEDWKAIFKVFGYINSVSLCGWDEVKCREDIVDAVCKEVPPETRRDDSHVQGRSRMCKTINEKIGGLELSNYYKVRVLGLYGVGGIGKSTACMALCNHYFEEFHGQVCHVEFGVGDELHMLREILRRLTNTKHEQIEGFDFHECKHRMKDIKNQKVFLAIDNVSESYAIVQQAKLILRAGFEKNSIVIVTARSLGELQNLNIDERDCMEMPELMVDDAMSLFVREVACVEESTDEHLIQQCVDHCYFSKGDGASCHYHPLALRVLGGQLGSDPSQWLEKLEAIDVFNQYREKHDKHPIFSILRRSFDVLKDEDKLLFMDCALFAMHFSFPFKQEGFVYKWLSMIHGKSMKFRLNGLKRKSLIQTLEEGTTKIGIHDLWRDFCVMEAKVGELNSRCWIYERLSDSNCPCIEGSSVYNGVWKKAQRVLVMGEYDTRISIVHLNLSCCSNLIAMSLQYVDLEGNVLDLNGAYNLKSLQVRIHSICEVRGLGSLRQLCLLEWFGEQPSNMTFIEEVGGLTNLQILTLSNFFSDPRIEFPNLSNLSVLQCFALSGLNGGVSISCNSVMSNLQELHLSYCESLRRCNGIGDLVELEELQISWCPNLEELPNLQRLKNLEKLDISGCTSIRRLLGVGDLATLLELRAYGCPYLVELPNLSKLTNLQVLELRGCSLNKAVIGLSELINMQTCTICIDGIEEFSDLHKLTKLMYMDVDGWGSQGSSIDSLVNLEVLSISNCRSVDSFIGLSKVTRLRRINMEDCEFKDVACLKDLIGLREVFIFGCNLLERFPDMYKARKLESLSIIGCKNLRVWDGLSRTRAISSEAIGVDLQSSATVPNLRSLDLSDVGITELPNLGYFPQLEVLRIHGCRSLVKLSSSVPLTSLKHFDVTSCESLIAIPNFNGCKHLESLSVRDCGVTLSKNEIEYLRFMCPKIHFDID